MMVGFGRSVSRWVFFSAAVTLGMVGNASAQGLGPFLWKLDPYCNTLTVTAFPDAGGFRLAGFGDQCGASQRAPIAGMVTLNPDGTFGFTFVVIAPDGRVSHTSAALNRDTVSGPWTDSVGQTGRLAFGVGAGGGPLRPLSSGGELQQRITGTCSGGQFVQVIGQDGSVTCATAPGTTGDITAVLPGAGLTGGAATGDATLCGLFNLRPVIFRYISQATKGDSTPEYGLIAEEVADVFPDLVVRNAAGDIETVQYHKLTPMLLNELQRQERTIQALQERLAMLEERLRSRER